MSITHLIFSILLLFPAIATAETPVLQHDLLVEFNAEKRSFTARDQIVVRRAGMAEAIELPDLTLNPRWRVTSIAFDGKTAHTYAQIVNGRIDVPDDTAMLDIVYGGEMDDSQWPYIVWLPGDGWYPEAEDHRVRFKLTLVAPSEWSALSQGLPSTPTPHPQRSWIQEDPQQGIYLVAGPWQSYIKQAGGHRAGVMLIEQDDELSSLYLDAALENLERYSKALGTYPYHSFTLVENRRQTGWGMPAFTLLGSQVIRLPFIVHTSFPHEILHNWWGNGVFVNTVEGNWSEGLTTYLSDYLMRERRGDGRQYRLDTLLTWHDYAARTGDFPLSRFVGRHDRATQAVGYGKGMFLFHMLRGELGDATFTAGLRELYAEFRFKHASFGDIQHAFEYVCDCALAAFFAQWLTRVGAPFLRLDAATPESKDGRHSLSIVLSQSGAEPWNLLVPLRMVDSMGNVTMQSVRLDGSIGSFMFTLAAPATRIDVDPEIELFRTLDPGEKPTTLSKIFAANAVSIVAADDSFAESAKSIAGHYPGWRVARAESEARAESDVVVLLGQDRSAAARWFNFRHDDRYNINDNGVVIEHVSHTLDTERVIALVDTVKVEGRSKTVLWIASKQSVGLVDLLRRLSHYGRFSYAVFDKAKSRATSTGQWKTEVTSLSRVFEANAAATRVRQPPPLF